MRKNVFLLAGLALTLFTGVASAACTDLFDPRCNNQGAFGSGELGGPSDAPSEGSYYGDSGGSYYQPGQGNDYGRGSSQYGGGIGVPSGRPGGYGGGFAPNLPGGGSFGGSLGPGGGYWDGGALGPSLPGEGASGGPAPGGTGGVADDGESGEPLLPVRAYIRTSEIPPQGFGAYGVVAFQSTATDANSAKLKMVCQSFVATFPKNSLVPDSVPVEDRMITLWPLFHVEDPAVAADDCDFVTSDYDLGAAALAIRDAGLQGAKFDGEGPYLIGWSPSSSRGKKDKLVLVVDLSAANNQIAVDRLFLFWKQKIVDDPKAWRGGFSIERLRVSIKDFADTYGQNLLDAIKLVSVH